tara:strand:+ start:297 stop:476 length:180 start_codon:yes stop_codon:yes gene_type:complete
LTNLTVINDITPFQAVLWCLYPVGIVVFFELILRAINGDDDDDDEGGGIMTPVYQGAAS